MLSYFDEMHLNRMALEMFADCEYPPRGFVSSVSIGYLMMQDDGASHLRIALDAIEF